MDKQQKEQKKVELTSQFSERIVFLQSQIDNLTTEFNFEVKKRQDEIDTLTLQNDALTNFKIK